MKIIFRLVMLVVLLVIVGVVIVIFNINGIIRSTVQNQATTSLNLPTTLGGANLSLFGGSVSLSDLQVANPKGFTALKMLTLGGASAAVSYGQLRSDPIHIKSIGLDKPVLVIENSGGQFNFKVAMDNMPKGEPTQPNPQKPEQKPLKLIIDDLSVTNATVIMHPGLNIPGIPAELNIPLATIDLKNIGNADNSNNGAAVKDVVMQVVTAMADAATHSAGVPDQLKALLKLNVNDVMGQLGGNFQDQLKGLEKQMPALGDAVNGMMKDPGALMKDPTKALQNLGGGKGLGGLLGGAGDKSPTTQPDPAKNAQKSIEQGLGGLLGGNKK